jgi:DNA-binding MarR family transcriptional regulator
MNISKAEYERLARFRRALRHFLRFSEVAARSEGLTPQQHQMLLAIRGMPGRDWATITQLAEALQLHHNAIVQLVNRAASMGLVERTPDPDDRRVVQVRLTAEGARKLSKLTSQHRDELRRLRDDLTAILAEDAAHVGGDNGDTTQADQA